MTARNFSLSKRLIESYTSPGCGRAFDRQPRLTGALEVRKLSNAPFSSDSIATSTAAWKATVLGAPPCSSGAVANNPNLLTPDVIASSQPDRVVSGAGKDHALIPELCSGVEATRGLVAKASGGEQHQTVAGSWVSRPSLHDTISSVLRMRTLPYNAINARRFKLDEDNFTRALGGGA